MTNIKDLMIKKKELGQYFTPKIITDFMVSLIENEKRSWIFEPSAGEGSFLKSLKTNGFENVEAYEIDQTLKNSSGIDIKYCDTLSQRPTKKFDVVIGNPPYVRWKNINSETKTKLLSDSYWNNQINGLNDLLYPFILLSIDLLKENGELIFITPNFWTSTLHAKSVRKKILEEGDLTHFINFEEMKVFDNVSSNLLIFRFVKGKNNRRMKVIKVTKKSRISEETIKEIEKILISLNENDKCSFDGYESFMIEQFNSAESWSPTHPSINPSIRKIEKGANSLLGEVMDIGNGMVSGLDAAFKINGTNILNENERSVLIKVAKAKNLRKYYLEDNEKYIFLNDLNLKEEELENYPYIKNQLIPYKEKLKERYGYNKNIKWWEWVFLRNRNLIEKKNKIAVPCKERFDGKGFVRFSLLEGDYYCTQDVTSLVKKDDVKEDLRYFLAVLNSDLIFNWLKYRSLRRGGVLEFSEKPLSLIPIKRIDWKNEKEVLLYNKIVELTNEIIIKKDNKSDKMLNGLINEIYGIS